MASTTTHAAGAESTPVGAACETQHTGVDMTENVAELDEEWEASVDEVASAALPAEAPTVMQTPHSLAQEAPEATTDPPKEQTL